MVKKKNKKVVGIVGIILALALLFFVAGDRFLTVTYTGDEEIQLAIPHMASYKCEPVQDKYGITISIPEGGALISKETVGFHTNGISNIQIVSQGSSWGEPRVRYFICDANGYNCGQERILTTFNRGTYSLLISSLNFETESLKIYSEKRGAVYIWNWYYWDGNRISFDGKVFGLRLYSTTRDPAGAKICTTSCSLDCPNIGYREKLLFTDETQLGFYETAPYLEYWETIDYDLNKQGGATIYNERTNRFCFAGAVYTGAKLEMDNGVTYLYPDENTRQNKVCCPGATISSTYSDLICQDDYTWKVIQDTDKLTCMSDYNCPGQGGAICQDRKLSGYHCINKDENNVGICQKESGTLVECCVNADCVRDQVCDIYTYTCKGGVIFPVCGDGKVDAGEQCDDGNLISGDGCTATCELEVDYCISHPEDPICSEGRCGSCWGWLRNEIEPGYCSQTILDKYLLSPVKCIIYFLKIGLLAILSIVGLFITKDFLMKIKSIRQTPILSWIISLLITGILTFILYLFLTSILFWIMIVGFVIIQVVLNFIPGAKLIRRKK